MFAHVITVVTGKHDDCIVGKAVAFKRIHNNADLSVHKTDAGIVSLPALPAQVVGQLFLLLFLTAKSRRRNVRSISFNPLHHRHFRFFVHIKVRRLRRHIRCVRTKEANGEKEWTLLVSRTTLQYPVSIFSHHRVGMMIVALRRRIPAQCSTELIWSQTENVWMFFKSIDTGRIEFHFPRSRIVMPVGPDRIWNVIVI